MHVVSIDPGKRSCGVAVFDSLAQLVHAQLVEGTEAKDWPRPAIWAYMAQEVHKVLAPWSAYGLVLEIPQVYGRHERSVDNNDLLDLAGVQGAMALGQKVHWAPTPAQWKGQLPKSITVSRVDGCLGAGEKGRIVWPNVSLRHNVYDAIHLGLVYLERL